MRLPGLGTSDEEQKGQRRKSTAEYTVVLLMIEVCIIRLAHEHDPPITQAISCTMFYVVFPEEGSESEKMDNEDSFAMNILDAQFYDDKQLVLVLQTVGTPGIGSNPMLVSGSNSSLERRAVTLLNFLDQEYQFVTIPSSSLDIEAEIIQRFNEGTVCNSFLMNSSHSIAFSSLHKWSQR